MPRLRIDRRLMVVGLAIAGLLVIACSSDEDSPPPVISTPVPTVSSTETVEPDFSGGPPTWPQVYSGNATASGQPVPAGFTVIARVGNYESQPIITLEGRYLALTVAPFDEDLWGRPITFHLVAPGGAEVQAEETETFNQSNQPTVDNTFPLQFPRLP